MQKQLKIKGPLMRQIDFIYDFSLSELSIEPSRQEEKFHLLRLLAPFFSFMLHGSGHQPFVMS